MRTMATFNARKPYFDGIGKKVTGAVTYEDALRLGELDYSVEKHNLFADNGTGGQMLVPNNYATVRTDTNAVLGVVGKDYEVVQNRDAFSFVEDLLQDGVGVIGAGNYGKDNKKSFILAQSESLDILGDKVENYLFINNSFDGGSSIQVAFTPVRMVCANGLIIVKPNDAKYKFTVRHFQDANKRMKEVKELMIGNLEYMHFVKRYAEYLASIELTKDEYIKVCEALIPMPEVKDDEETARQLLIDRRNAELDDLIRAYNESDLSNFANSAYKAIMAISDHESHYAPKRKSSQANECALKKVLNGMKLLNTAVFRIENAYGYRAKITL